MRRLAIALAAAAALLSGCTPRKFAGLLPLEPPAPGFIATSPTPELRWEPLPADPRIADVVYDVRIYSMKTLWVEREGLTEPRYLLEKQLVPGRVDEWTVRARYRYDGARRRTEWTEREDTWSRDGTVDDRERTYVPLVFPSESDAPKAPAETPKYGRRRP